MTGATGMVGGNALKICLANPDVSLVTAIGRRSRGINHARLREVIVDDFTDRDSFSRCSQQPGIKRMLPQTS